MVLELSTINFQKAVPNIAMPMKIFEMTMIIGPVTCNAMFSYILPNRNTVRPIK